MTPRMSAIHRSVPSCFLFHRIYTPAGLPSGVVPSKTASTSALLSSQDSIESSAPEILAHNFALSRPFSSGIS
jgi:hypothetical protein